MPARQATAPRLPNVPSPEVEAEEKAAWCHMIEITRLTKGGGPLTKRISLAPDGTLRSDGSACLMLAGTAQRARFDDLAAFADHIATMASREAIALGALRDDLPEEVQITTKRQLNGTNTRLDLIARTADHIVYRPDQLALALIDIDTKGMPSAVRDRIDAIGGYWRALVSVLPALESVGRVVRSSTSSGLKTDTDEQLRGSDGLHIYIKLKDGAEAVRFLRCLHDRCWLHGFGWLMVGAAGQLLERSVVDRMVGAPERLVFEGAPVLDPPLLQDAERRRPKVWEGVPLDTKTAIPEISIPELARLARLKMEASRQLEGECRKARIAFITKQTKRLTDQGVMPDVARRAVEQLTCGVLLPAVILPFDSPEFTGCTVADMLADPQRFVGATLADPVEGIEYGICKARVMQRADGSLWVHSFAHGRTTYDLKYDAQSLHVILANTPEEEVIERYVHLARHITELSGLERSRFRLVLIRRLGLGARETDRRIREAESVETAKDAEAHAKERKRQRESTGDLRPQLRVPEQDAPIREQVAILNNVMAQVVAAEPPMRDEDGYLAEVHARRVLGMHELTSRGANDEAEPDRLPAPEHLLLNRLNEIDAAELVEQHIDYADSFGRSVRLPVIFVRAYLQRRNCVALPRVSSVATMPVILPDGAMLSGHYLDRERRILFRVQERLEKLLPDLDDCAPEDVAEAVRFLTDEWLVDVATSHVGKLKLLALALTILERGVLPERPAFFITAGQRGGGKTTVTMMVAVATLGERVSAAAWSFADEERRKSLLSYFGEGVPLIAWDNIPRGATISCPSIEKALTTETYTDRVLGSSETRNVPATAVMVFTGNNIAPKGDTASRSLVVRLAADRPDPENRKFRHADPIAWTYAHRGQILRSLYTILRGNPRLTGEDKRPPETRFKHWWHLIGAAIEYAASEHVARPALHGQTKPEPISFREQFLANDDEDEQGNALSIVLTKLRERWPGSFKAADVAAFMTSTAPGAAQFQADFMSALEVAASRTNPKSITGQTLSWRLKGIVDAPAWVGELMMSLRRSKASDHLGDVFSVRPLKGGS